MSNVKVIRLGLGEMVSSWGTHNGVPAVFLEPVLGRPDLVGHYLEDGREPQIRSNAVSDDGIIIEIHDQSGAQILIEDMNSAIDSKLNKSPEAGTPSRGKE